MKGLSSNALKNSGHKENIELQHNIFVGMQERKNKRPDRIIWLDPLYSGNIATVIGRKVFHIPRQTFS